MNKADSSLVRLENSLARVEKIVMEKGDSIETVIDGLDGAMGKANTFLDKGTSLMSGADNSLALLSGYILVIAQNLEKASENINQLTEIIKDNPSELIFGDPPAPRKLEKRD